MDDMYFLCSIDKLSFPSTSIFSFLLQLPSSSCVSQIIKELCSSSSSFSSSNSFQNFLFLFSFCYLRVYSDLQSPLHFFFFFFLFLSVFFVYILIFCFPRIFLFLFSSSISFRKYFGSCRTDCDGIFVFIGVVIAEMLVL